MLGRFDATGKMLKLASGADTTSGKPGLAKASKMRIVFGCCLIRETSVLTVNSLRLNQRDVCALSRTNFDNGTKASCSHSRIHDRGFARDKRASLLVYVPAG